MGPRKSNTLFPVKLLQLKIVIKETVHSVNNTIENNDSYNDTRVQNAGRVSENGAQDSKRNGL